MLIMTEDQRKELLGFLSEDLDAALAEREKMERRWAKWERQREAMPEQEVRNWPWPKSANVCVPLAAINTESTYAKLKGMFTERDPFWHVGTRDPKKWQEHADAMTDLLDFYAESSYHLNLRANQNTILYCAGSEGVHFTKVMWLEEKRQFKRMGEDGLPQVVEKIVHDGPAIIPIPIQDVIFRPCVDLQRVPALHHRVYFYDHEMMEKQRGLIYENVENVLSFYENSPAAIETEQLKRLGVEPGQVKLYPVFESWVHYDVDGDGITEDLIVTWERMSMTVLREDYNEMGIRMIEPLKVGIRPWSIYGVGAGWKNEHMQDEIDGLHNWRSNGVQLSGLRMFGIKRTGIVTEGEEELYPGKMWPLDNPKQDLVPIQAGEVYPSSLEAEMVDRGYAREWNAVSDATVGQPDTVAKTRTTLGGQVNQLQQQGVIFGATSQQMKEGWSNIGQMVFFLLVRHKDRVIRDLGRFPDGKQRLIREALDMSLEDIPLRFTFEVRTSDVEETRAAKRQARLTLVQLYTMYWKEITNILMAMSSPQVPEMVKAQLMKAYTGATKLMEKIFEDFDEKDTDEFIPDYRVIDMKVKQMEAAITQMIAMKAGGGSGDFNGGSGQAPVGYAGQPGMGAVPGMGQGATGVPGQATAGQPGA